jgi:hypothetical protein
MELAKVNGFTEKICLQEVPTKSGGTESEWDRTASVYVHGNHLLHNIIKKQSQSDSIKKTGLEVNAQK